MGGRSIGAVVGAGADHVDQLAAVPRQGVVLQAPGHRARAPKQTRGMRAEDAGASSWSGRRTAGIGRPAIAVSASVSSPVACLRETAAIHAMSAHCRADPGRW